MVAVYPALREHLTGWAGDGPRKAAIAVTILNLADAGIEIARRIAQGPLADSVSEAGGGDARRSGIDLTAYEIVTAALKKSPVSWMGAQDREPVPLNAGAPLAVNVDPIDGSSNFSTNLTLGTIFSILPGGGDSPLLQPGRNQLAAGYIVYGPQTALALTAGQGTHMFWFAPDSGQFLLAREKIQIPPATREFAINASNFRYWEDAIKAYVIECTLGTDGPRQADFNMRWLASLAAEAFRIFTRGGIYLYPCDGREGYTKGRLLLLCEANPIAMLTEQAGGACTTGTRRILDIEPESLHQRTSLVFGSKAEVEEVAHYCREPHSLGDRSPLFSQRGLFRSFGG